MIIKFFRVLSSEASPLQISFGFALAMILGFTPLLSPHNLVVLFVLLVFRINLASFLLAFAVFSGVAYLLDPWFNNLGQAVLSSEVLIPVWTDMYNSAFWRLTQFNNTLVMGSLVVSLLAFIPFVLLSNILVRRYRTDVYEYVKNHPITRLIKSNKWFSRIVSLAE